MKVGRITVQGNKAFSQRKIIRTMSHDRPYAIPLGITYIPVMSKTLTGRSSTRTWKSASAGCTRITAISKLL